MPIRPDFRSMHGRIIHHNLQTGFSIIIAIDPIDHQISVTAIYAVFISVYQQTVIIHITFDVRPFHISVIIDPKNRNTITCHRIDSLRLSVTIQILQFRFKTGRR